MPFLQRRATCFFCLSTPCPAPLDPHSYRCPHCGCWNRYDANGEILSDEPAMHDENLNASSFALRASQNRDRLPSTYPKPPFCHACQTNQMLLLNLLSNYLPPPQASPSEQSLSPFIDPPPQHPDYVQRLEQLPAYRESLHLRYPPVCANCLPAVQDEIENKNQMARTKALGGWLNETNRKERQRLASAAPTHRETLRLHLAIWRARGTLWWFTLLAVLVAYAAAIRGYNFPRSLAMAIPVLPLFCFLSLFYMTWNPTYYRFKKARVQGRDVRIKGKTRYVILQALAWLSRFITSILLVLPRQSPSCDYLRISTYPSSYRVSMYCSVSLVVELLVLSSSFTILHLQRPPAIRLIETSPARGTPESSAHSARASPMPGNNEPDLFASLSLTSKPLMASTNPIFGHPSLVSSTLTPTASIKVDESPDEDAMDWTPTVPSPIKTKRTADDDGIWLRPQRFFPPEHPTGLESLFANAKLDDRGVRSSNPTTTVQRDFWNARVIGWSTAAVTIILIPLGTVVCHRWMKDSIQ